MEENPRPLAQLDSRFPETFERSIPQAVAVLMRYFAALSRRDPVGMSLALHFPCAFFDGTDPVIFESPEEFIRRHLKEELGFDILDGLELHIYNPVGAGLSLAYSRYDAAGRKMFSNRGIYAVTNNDRRWGIELCSTIISEADGELHEEACEAGIRLGREWMVAYTRRDQALLNSTQQLGRQARVWLADPRVAAKNARTGKPLDTYRIEGVASRLSITEVTVESLANADAKFDEFAELAGGGVGTWGYTLNLPDARVLHASPDKAHVLGGFVRYTKDGVSISESHTLSIVTLKNGRWGTAGGIAAEMHHDYTNDARE